MTHQHNEAQHRPRKATWVLIAFAAVAGFFLITEHQAHLYGALPYLLLLACPLMHLFHGHGNHHGSHGDTENSEENSNARDVQRPVHMHDHRKEQS